MTEKTFEENISHGIKESIIKTIANTDFIQPNYNHRKPLPPEFLEKVWAQVNWDSVLEHIKPQIETQICNAIIGNIGTEIKTDVKNILAIDGIRQKIRVTVYPELMKILNSVEK